MLPYKTWVDKNGDWFAEVYDGEHAMWRNLGPFEDEEMAAYAAVRFLQHE